MRPATEFGVGDIGFYMGDSIFSKTIEQVEKSLDHTTHRFIPSHVFMVLSLNPLTVVEAIVNDHYNSVAAVDPGDPYAEALKLKGVILVRPVASEAAKLRALSWLINNYQSHGYGWLVDFGFLFQKWFNLKKNPLGNTGRVCSQAGWMYLQRLVQECLQEGDSLGAADASGVVHQLSVDSTTPDLLLLSLGVDYELRMALLRC